MPLPKFMTSANATKLGYGLCLSGLGVALLSFVPALVPYGTLPWPVFVGSMIYLPGAFLAFASTRGKDRRIVFNHIRMIRLSFIAILLLMWFSIARQ